VIAAYTKPELLQRVKKGPSVGLAELLGELNREDEEDIKDHDEIMSGQIKSRSNAKRNSVMNI
jgi:hypothetical protein